MEKQKEGGFQSVLCEEGDWGEVPVPYSTGDQIFRKERGSYFVESKKVGFNESKEEE